MSILKKLATVKVVNKSQDDDSNLVNNEIEIRTYYSYGEEKCRNASGNPHILNSFLEENYQQFKRKNQRDEVRQKQLKKGIVDEKESQNSQLKRREIALDIKNEEFENLDKEIAEIKHAISDVRQDPHKYGLDVEKKPTASFIIGLLLLLPMTIYLLVFYISASYSTFFKVFTADSSLIESIFDGQAITKAYTDANGGILQVLFICTIPFVFMGLGYLIHMFRKKESNTLQNSIKVIGLLVITFVFDALLAFFIQENLYEISKTPTSAPYDLNVAIQSPGFWIIIFAGFVVYVVWGIVFDFVMAEYENIDKIKVFIRAKKKEIQQKDLKKIEIKEMIYSIKEEIAGIEGKIRELNSQINGFVFEKKAYLLYHTQFFSGWCAAIGEFAMPSDTKDQLLKECNEVEEKHKQLYKLTSSGSENIFYSKVI